MLPAPGSRRIRGYSIALGGYSIALGSPREFTEVTQGNRTFDVITADFPRECDVESIAVNVDDVHPTEG